MATADKAGKDDFVFPDEKEVDLTAKPGEIEIEVVDDTPPKDRGRKPLEKPVAEPTDEELENVSASVRKRIKELTHARHDERRAKEALERQAQEQEQLIRSLMDDRNEIAKRYNAGAESFGKVAKDAAEAELRAAKAKLKKAKEDFDTEAEVEAQAELAAATLRVETAKSYKPTPIQTDDTDVKTRVSQPTVKPDKKSEAWQAANPWFGRPGDEDATSYALGLHQKLVKSGVDPRSDEYFETIDARMKSKFPELFDGSDDDDDPPARPASNRKPAPDVVAPASREPASPGKVRLTQTQLALAKKYGLTPQQYAAEVLKLQKESRNG